MLIPEFRIDLEEKFPSLERAPIVEVVIQFHAPPSTPFDQQALKELLSRRFAEYKIQEQVQHETGVRGASGGHLEMHHRSEWDGYRLSSADDKYICQWRRNGLIFSRLQPYQQWNAMLSEAMAFWDAYVDAGRPEIVEGIGVRFISQIPLHLEESPSRYLRQATPPLQGLGLSAESCFYQDTIPIRSYPYEVRLIRAVQPAAERTGSKRILIVDIDASSTTAVSFDDLGKSLDELRYIKNKVFFTIMKDAKKRFK